MRSPSGTKPFDLTIVCQGDRTTSHIYLYTRNLCLLTLLFFMWYYYRYHTS